MTATLDPAGLAIDEQSLAVLFHDAHTAYAFTDEPVADAQLAAIYDAARMAPTALNSQPLRVAYLRGEAKERLIPLLGEGNRAKSQSAPVVAVLAFDLDFHDHLDVLAPHMPNARAMFDDPSAREAFARTSALIQVGYFILAARAMGLDVGPMAGFDAAAVDAEFLAGTGWRSLVVVNLGHAADGGTRPRSGRLDESTAVVHLG